MTHAASDERDTASGYLGAIATFPQPQNEPDPPGALFFLGGYSWRYRAFYAWKLVFEDNAFRYLRVVRGWENRTGWRYAFGGDEDVVDAAYDRLIKVLRASGREKTQEDGLDMEPLEVLRDIIRENEFPDVGGPTPSRQGLSTLNTQFFGIPSSSGSTRARFMERSRRYHGTSSRSLISAMACTASFASVSVTAGLNARP